MSATDVLDTLIPSEIDRVARTTNPGWERLLTTAGNGARVADEMLQEIWDQRANDPTTDRAKLREFVAKAADTARERVRSEAEAAFSQLETEIKAEASRQRAKVTAALSGGGDTTAQLLFEQRVQNARPSVMRRLGTINDGAALADYYRQLLDNGDLSSAAVLERETDSFFRYERKGEPVDLSAFSQLRREAIMNRLPTSARWAIEALGELEHGWSKALRGYRALYQHRINDVGAVVLRANDPSWAGPFEPAEKFPLWSYGIGDKPQEAGNAGQPAYAVPQRSGGF